MSILAEDDEMQRKDEQEAQVEVVEVEREG